MMAPVAKIPFGNQGDAEMRPRKFGPRVTVSLTGEDYDVLSTLADQGEVSVSWLVRRAIDDYLEQHRHEAEPALPLRLLQQREQ